MKKENIYFLVGGVFIGSIYSFLKPIETKLVEIEREKIITVRSLDKKEVEKLERKVELLKNEISLVKENSQTQTKTKIVREGGREVIYIEKNVNTTKEEEVKKVEVEKKEENKQAIKVEVVKEITEIEKEKIKTEETVYSNFILGVGTFLEDGKLSYFGSVGIEKGSFGINVFLKNTNELGISLNYKF